MNRLIAFFSVVLLFCSMDVLGQPDITTMDIKKPAKYETRILGSEKSATTKFTKVRRFVQDNVTHYNYYFNANNKINEILARAKSRHVDDYTKLLPFYNYTLEVTARDRRELDSVIYKSTMGILIHDLRNDWIDNLYMLIGKAYYFRNMPDSAYITFQFVNYAYSPKETGGYDKPIGSNANEGGNAFTVSTLEKRNIPQKILTLPPSRNEAFIWLIRTNLSRNAIPQAAGLIETLKHDPQFPARLQPQLEEMQAWWFYKKELYDSSAIHLENALENAVTREEKARWEYLIAQMYQRSGNTDKAKEFYEKVFHLTYDPVLEVYARLNFIRQNKGNDAIIQQNIDALLKMAKKDRYESYRDIIYFTVAEIELEQNKIPEAEMYLLRCVKYAQPNSTQKNKAFLLLANLAFDRKKYKPAKNYYDSVNVNDELAVTDPNMIIDRRKALDKIVTQLDIIERQDSLQRLAGMSKSDRDAFIKALVKNYRKQQGLAEENQQQFFQQANNPFSNSSTTRGPNGNTTTADWYFDNSALKTKGYTDFKAKWGNRTNEDNWMLSSLASQQIRGIASDRFSDKDSVAKATGGGVQYTYDAMIAKIPLTPDKMKISNDSVEAALFSLGKSYQEGLPDYPAAIDAYEKLLSRYPETKAMEQTLFNLYYCYKKIGDEANAARVLALLKQKYPSSRFTTIITNPKSLDYAIHAEEIEATKKYEDIYTAFIEGRFDEARAEKQTADKLYGNKYWTPQLLYIESVYFIQQRQDSAAIVELNHIIAAFSGTPMAARAKNLIDVLGRRKQIEDYLTNLQIQRAKEDSIAIVDDRPVQKQVVKPDSVQQNKEDSSQVARAKIRVSPTAPGARTLEPGKLGMQQLKADAAQSARIKTDSSQLVRLRQQQDSLLQAMKKVQADSANMARLKRQADSLQAAMQKIKDDSIATARNRPKIQSAFAYDPDQPHSVVIVMNKVDPVYVTETRNAFSRYNRESYNSLALDINNQPFTDTVKFVVISGFVNAAAALDYMDKAAKQAPRDIVPWLPSGKYTFIIATADNLGLLESNKDIIAYKKFLAAYFPDRFNK